MLDVTGAGATASISQDWHETWTSSEEYKAALTEMEELHEQGRKRPPVEATLEAMFATGWVHQTGRLLWRNLASYWRNRELSVCFCVYILTNISAMPATYIMSKLMLNIIGGLFIGFTFFKAKNTIQGTRE
jgi:ATP-binding cassette, subfamily G (WHITE), member 2, SNQ2